ncbi:unnamed protein product [Triticum turgidum subsp. durum]|uniref:Xyloglucan endo-transglycosylase C-terminal domain-containing protein n=1 Tax=Triticum turgidum subsp. durum TaxID=4567 RepID=A0A9R1A8R1_TRITD|nr:unnamed protein product [Triticum turgidum subsp. durum]
MAVSVLAILLASCALAAATFDKEFDVTWGDGRGKILNNGQLLTLGLASIGTEVAPGTGAVGEWYNQELDLTRQQRMRWVQSNYMIYNYCTDPKRVAKGVPAECSM